ncbi:amidohydrolase family protein [Novosphingobium mangrovi (ex Hu et al. 2023)]|uniref:Amidohydrolase family protein n=1 Tax=Novosphingobium mangrovi (ex Hu et al. 2023) TaxID=2930094 RepID=A0ABT0AEG7_9SPHN|nr:amidohydrolase family protein [Novosphingobium mangrovi (ex Hu et al. 2023)]MCJ1961584.1 amidohydrolase family protein [Novosphingobium mangrovi (ex Hu et al. 2023)]
MTDLTPAILEPDLAIVDAHHHLFHNANVTYGAQDYARDATSGHKVIASVYVDAHSFYRPDGPEVLRPLGEVEYANGIGAMARGGAFGGLGLCAGIVGHADLRHGAAVGELLDRAMAAAPERFRGIRQTTMDFPDERPYRYFMSGKPPMGVLEHPRFREGFAELARRGLSFDAAAFHHRLPEIAKLADAFPDTPIIVNNMGIAMALDTEGEDRRDVFALWAANLTDLAQRGNVTCKVGGLGMPFWNLGLHERTEKAGPEELARLWQPLIETALNAFGPARCMACSNYPPDSRSASYVDLWNALKLATTGFSGDERNALFHGTAKAIYRLDLP